MSSAIESILQRGITLWKEITKGNESATYGGYKATKSYEELDEAVRLDPTKITAALLLAHLANSHLAGEEITLLDLLEQPQAIEERLSKPRELRSLLLSDEVVHARGAFEQGLRMALDRYGASENAAAQALLGRPDDLAILRRDALKSIDTLEVRQFLAGAAEDVCVQPIYNRTIHQWWNVGSMLASMTKMPSGVSINLIRHPEMFESYFCFAIRNGGNLFVLTDAEKHAHPLQAGLSRRPDRTFERRRCKNWFPYDLLDIGYDEEAERLYVKESRQRALAPKQNAALPLTPLAEVDAHSLVWIAMMFELIVEKFWRRQYQAPALAYTAEMIVDETALLGQARDSAMSGRLAPYQPVGLPPVAAGDLRGDHLSEEHTGSQGSRRNAWLEERYADRVPSEIFNLLGAPERVFALDLKEGAVTEVEDNRSYRKEPDWGKERILGTRLELAKLDATAIGSREELHADRIYIARANQAMVVDALAREEFEARKEEVLTWYRQHVRANRQMILSWAAAPELWIDDGIHDSWDRYEGLGTTRSHALSDAPGAKCRIARPFLSRFPVGDTDTFRPRACLALGGWKAGGPLCAINDTRASYIVSIQPANPRELALLAGCEVQDLPDVLQHWDRLVRHDGNHILARIDPMLWKVRNPWLQLALGIHVPLSKRGLASLEKLPATVPDLPNISAKAPF